MLMNRSPHAGCHCLRVALTGISFLRSDCQTTALIHGEGTQTLPKCYFCALTESSFHFSVTAQVTNDTVKCKIKITFKE